jgi:hypothetical protein
LTEKNISGHYRDSYNFENLTYLQLDQDHNYHFKQQTGLVFVEGNGKWSFKNDTLLLTSRDTSALTIIEMRQQKFVINGATLVEVSNGKPTGLKLKRS